LPKTDFERLSMQSVVEDIVFSAAFWARREETRAAAFELLRRVVERTIGGEYWNTASYAMTTLCRHQCLAYADLLTRFQQFAFKGKVDEHPTNTDLMQEKEFAQHLAAKNPNTLVVIESSLNQKETAATAANLDDNSRAAIDQLVKVAERFDGA
jgi:hypothetical protein